MSSPNSEDEEAASMAALMGFSTFGSHKPPAKKRKFNASTDAFVDGQELARLDRGGKKGAGSGGNMVKLGRSREIGGGNKGKRGGNEEETELDLEEDGEEGGVQVALKEGRIEGKGVRRIQSPPPVNVAVRGGNGDEIPLDLDDEDEGPRYEDTSRPPPPGTEDGPAYLDTSEEAPTEATAAVMEAYQAALFARHPPGAGVLENDEDAPPDDEDGDARTTTSYTSTLPPPPFDLPQRPPFADTGFMQGSSRGAPRGAPSEAGSMGSRGGRGRGRGGHGGGQREYNQLWYEGYYDPGFNENPWAKLEKEKGLQSVGTWVERPTGKYDSRRKEMMS